MDTTLMTFMVKTSLSTSSVHLIGSWDKFSKHYSLSRDFSQAQLHWRGCYQFENITCDGDQVNRKKRKGGLKMGVQYFYYYELDGIEEYYDPALPFTTNCPYLPGQPVNILSVPIEVPTLREHRASMSSARGWDIKTTNPADKFNTTSILPANLPQPPHTSCYATTYHGIESKSTPVSSSSISGQKRKRPSLFNRTGLKDVAPALCSTSSTSSIRGNKSFKILERFAPVIFKSPVSFFPRSPKEIPDDLSSPDSKEKPSTDQRRKKERKLLSHLMPLRPWKEKKKKKKTNSLPLALTLSTVQQFNLERLNSSLQNQSSENCLLVPQKCSRTSTRGGYSSIAHQKTSLSHKSDYRERLQLLVTADNDSVMTSDDSPSPVDTELSSDRNYGYCKLPMNHPHDLSTAYSQLKSFGLVNEVSINRPMEVPELSYVDGKTLSDLDKLEFESGYLSHLIIK